MLRHDDWQNWRGRRVLVTGHTGFQGGWLCRALHLAGAEVYGFSLDVPTSPSFFETARVQEVLAADLRGDIRCAESVSDALKRARPDVVFHLAAQGTAKASMESAYATFETNVMGTVQVLECIRKRELPCAVVTVTSDACYRPSSAAHREDAPLGGEDPFSASKAAAELAIHAWRQSFAPTSDVDLHGIAIATVRAGDIFGGGDYASGRLVPDIVRAFGHGEAVRLRRATSTRSWQHVLEPVRGYMMLANALLGGDAWRHCCAWNFGPDVRNTCSVASFASRFSAALGGEPWERHTADFTRPEFARPRIDASQAQRVLDWAPTWGLRTSIDASASWYAAAFDAHTDVAALTDEQILTHHEAATRAAENTRRALAA